jgi:hypothetical protein
MSMAHNFFEQEISVSVCFYGERREYPKESSAPGSRRGKACAKRDPSWERWCKLRGKFRSAGMESMRRVIGRLLLLVVLVVLPSRGILSQSPAGDARRSKSAVPRSVTAPASRNVTRVELATNSAPPGTVAVLPIYFAPARGVTAVRIEIKVSFPAASLKFEKVERGDAAEKANVEVTTTAENVKTVTAKAASSDGGQTAAAIPAGVLGTIAIRVGANAKHGNVDLKVHAEVADASGVTVENVRTPAAQVKIPWIDAPPSVSCFFFSH